MSENNVLTNGDPGHDGGPTIADVPESQRHRVCFCKVADGRMHLRGDDCRGNNLMAQHN